MTTNMLHITTDLPALLTHTLADTPHEGLFVLADTHTAHCCLPLLVPCLPAAATDAVIVIPAGEEHKDVTTLSTVWEALSQRGATRRSLLLCVGGGVVTDLGGFAAATFKRGISYINIPTTLLAMVDAATGGKTGIDHAGLKNEVGAFHLPLHTMVCPAFLATLPEGELLSGLGEMCKHVLIAPDSPSSALCELEALTTLRDASAITCDRLSRTIAIKEYYVSRDPTEQSVRRALNFGHTVGHAIESLLLARGAGVPHGVAVAWGMVAELYLSHVLCGLPLPALRTASRLLREGFGSCPVTCRDYDALYRLMQHDKKNPSPGVIRPALLADVGSPYLDVTAGEEVLYEALDFLREGV